MLRIVILAAAVFAIIVLAVGPRALHPRSLKRALCVLAGLAPPTPS